ncbi:Beta-adaptin-like protein A [Glycine soja]|uniref:Beta-adaptin-like protein A n=1 Tax=Glycine soja TaxID=3848 RepID=A0A445G9B1_GLYSO|nr:Beta-adaptin-like protein A [Glycine soja]
MENCFWFPAFEVGQVSDLGKQDLETTWALVVALTMMQWVSMVAHNIFLFHDLSLPLTTYVVHRLKNVAPSQFEPHRHRTQTRLCLTRFQTCEFMSSSYVHCSRYMLENLKVFSNNKKLWLFTIVTVDEHALGLKDVRDRTLFYYKFLQYNVSMANSVVNPAKQAVSVIVDTQDELGNLSISAESVDSIVPAQRVEANDKDLLLSTLEKDEGRDPSSNGSVYNVPSYNGSYAPSTTSEPLADLAFPSTGIFGQAYASSLAIDDLRGLDWDCMTILDTGSHQGSLCLYEMPSKQNTYSDIVAAYKCLEESYRAKQEGIIVYRQSVGSGPTLDLAARLPQLRVVILHCPILSGFRELAEPSIRDAFESCIEQGVHHIIVCPFILFPGRHWSQDIPSLSAEVVKEHPDVSYNVTAPVGLHELFVV